MNLLAGLIYGMIYSMISAFIICYLATSTTTSFFGKGPQKDVIIYAATTFFGKNISNEHFLGKCASESWCRISHDLSDLPRVSAVLFHNRDSLTWVIPDFPRNPSIPYVLWSIENGINWTMTYRRDSEVWYPYGQMIRRNQSVEVDLEKIWKMKNNTATWLASNCFAYNRRTQIVERMQKEGLQIDRWGSCGKLPPNCNGHEKQEDQCVVDLIRPYKFYIAFENSECKEYVTEKFYETMRSRMAVPLVIKRSIYEDLGILGNSFIALDDFTSVKEMVEYIKTVANNKTAYLNYHKWRRDYEILPEHDESTGFCALCRKLREGAFQPKSYNNLLHWHNHKMCEVAYTSKFLLP